jgi:hypothetical protein
MSAQSLHCNTFDVANQGDVDYPTQRHHGEGLLVVPVNVVEG